MNLSKLRKSAIFGVAALIAATGSTQAVAATCGITGSASASPVDYDPFGQSDLIVTQVELVLTRVNGAGGEKTDTVNFYLKSNSPGADGTEIIPRSAVGSINTEGLNLDIFYDFNEAAPAVSPTTLSPNGAMRFLKVDFTGNNKDSDSVRILFDIRLPANLDLTAINELPFDAFFGCSTTGGGGPTQQSGSISNAITFPINVLSALQATYAGTALDFGEIGDVTDADVAGSPAAYVTPPVNYVRVQSSGPYSIELTSQNNYTLTPGASGTADPLQRVDYRLKFLGQERDTANSSPIDYICPRAGVGIAAEDRLYLQAQLGEGGAGKLPSPDYRDLLTVTIAPLAAMTPPTSPGECSNLSGQF